MINLGPYSGKNCPNVHFQPTIIDRILEGVALLVLLAVWGSVYWLYTSSSGWVSPHIWVTGGAATFAFIIVAACAYAPVRRINFPVRVSERNIGIQYLLAIRLTRAMNVVLGLIFLSSTYMESYALATVFYGVSFILLAIVFIVYFILAFKNK